jgi:tetratricopeptide (TPR) repeat protein
MNKPRTDTSENGEVSAPKSRARESDSILGEFNRMGSENVDIYGEIKNFPSNEDINFTETGKEYIKLLLEKASTSRMTGNSLFKKGKYRESIVHFLNAVKQLNHIQTQNECIFGVERSLLTGINSAIVECLNSVSVAYFLIKEYDNSIIYADEILNTHNSNNFIALSTKAKALNALGKYQPALDYIKQALSVKYSKTLMEKLKELEEKMGKSSSPSIIRLEEDVNKSIDIQQSDETNNRFKLPPEDNLFSFFINLWKFVKINCLKIIKKHKLVILGLLLLYVLFFRKRFINKLNGLLQALKFN